MAISVLNVPTTSCAHYVNTITSALTPLAGVSSVRVDIQTRNLTVEYGAAATSIDTFGEVLADADYPIEAVE